MVIFRCPYDSVRVARFLNLNEAQESYLKVLPKREAIVTIPNYPYPFRIKTLDSELSKLLPPQPHAGPPTPPYSQEDADLVTEDGDENLDDDQDDFGDATNADVTDKEEEDRYQAAPPVGDHGIGDAVDKDDLNRLLKKGVDSDKFKVFKAVALRSPGSAEASTMVEEEFGGQWWRVIDAYRILQDAKVWREPLIRTIGDLDKENEDIYFHLTQYGEKVWKAITNETTNKSSR